MSDESYPIVYRQFWDVPRSIFFCTPRGDLIYLVSPFDEEVDDYLRVYRVYLMPPDLDREGSWVGIEQHARALLGEVPLDSIGLDESRRRTVSASSPGVVLIERWCEELVR